MKISTCLSIFLMTLTFPSLGHCFTPSGSWTLVDDTPDVKDYFFRVNVDPGEEYKNISTDVTAPSSVYFAQYVTFQQANGGYLGLQRSRGQKRALVSLWTGDKPEESKYFNAVGGALPKLESCHEFGKCSSIQGAYAWKVGHQYRFRFEKSPTLKDKGGQWWQITLTDLTTNRTDILGQLETPLSFGGLKKSNGLFLEYFWGPYRCDTLRHANTTYYAIQGNWGKSTKLASKDGTGYGKVHECANDLLLPNTSATTLGSSSYVGRDNAVEAVGNQYRGVQKWDSSVNFVRQGIFYSKNLNDTYPVLWQAKKTGHVQDIPTTEVSNSDWRFIGLGYPIINDLYLTNRPLFQWDQRNDRDVIVGDYFVYSNPYSKDVEYFKLKRKSAGYFPTDKSSNADWEYIGRHFIKGEPLKPQVYSTWGANNRYGKVGEVFRSGHLLFRLKTTAQYWYFPDQGATSNTWWDLIGILP
ncbi:hypothetical protein [Acinetobacter rathckeae]|uniref:hypothetical protein n=1 Tax=Acinetobacter rathckeae TaxID=2605272 RepID=UPI0018A30522|nr:hypothetical protein [Acinetobacter rathckeae]MBF7687560.1 hypothetical protein [Acinetobacter rathckeae]MBF7694962.1 hypothetical protein [Acinetobacter rathckeae]